MMGIMGFILIAAVMKIAYQVLISLVIGQYDQMIRRDQPQQDQTIQQQIRQMTMEQQQFQQMMMEQQLLEQARLSATGIEFGGYNPDPALNPGMFNNYFS